MEKSYFYFGIKPHFLISLIIVLNLFFVSLGKCEGIYEIKYTIKFNTDINFTALVFFYSNESKDNLMRIRYFNGSNWVVLEQKVSQTIFTSVTNKNYWAFKGTNNHEVNDTSKKITNQDLYFMKLPTDSIYHPYSAISGESPNEHVGTITSFKILNRNDISKSYLADFDWEWSNPTVIFEPQKIHLILATNSNDIILGNGFIANHNKLKSFFSDIATVCGASLDITEITGSNFNRNFIIQTINNFSPSTNDIVIFYYSGHGYHKFGDTTSWPMLDLRQGFADPIDDNYSISLTSDIYIPLVSKGARLTIVIGECCNMTLGSVFPIEDNPVLIAPSNMLNSASVKTIFNKKGKLLIASSNINEPSYYRLSTGGDFCNNLITALIQETGISNQTGIVKWSDIINSASQGTLKESSSQPQTQTPIEHNEIVE